MAIDLTIPLDPNSPVPLYHQIADGLKAEISRGGLARGEYLPSELVLAEIWQVSRPTARRALQELVDGGMLVRRRGIGTQVVASRVRRAPGLTSLYRDLVGEGRVVTTRVTRLEVIPAPEEIASHLELAPGDPVIEVERIRFADGTPLALMHNWLPRVVAPDLNEQDLEKGSLYDSLRATGVQPYSGTQIIGAKSATDPEAEALGLEPGAALLTQRRIVHDVSGRVIEFGQHVYDAEQYSMEFTAVGG